jgi:hypothetical protein
MAPTGSCRPTGAMHRLRLGIKPQRADHAMCGPACMSTRHTESGCFGFYARGHKSEKAPESQPQAGWRVFRDHPLAR